MSKNRWCASWGRNCFGERWKAEKSQYLNEAAAQTDPMGFCPVSLFVYLRNKSQMPSNLMTTKKQSDLGLLRQIAKIHSYWRGWTQLSWGTIPSRNHWKAADDWKYSPAESTNTIWEVPTKNCNWEFMNWVYMLMHSFLSSSVSVTTHLLPRDLKEESLYTCERSWVQWQWLSKSRKKGCEMVRKTRYMTKSKYTDSSDNRR